MLSGEFLVFRNGKWEEGGRPEGAHVGVRDVFAYGANVIGYVRIVLCLIAAPLTGQYAWTAAALLLASTLLDWVDGPVARRAGQCSLFGSGVDWLADVAAQVIAMAWLVMLHPGAFLWIAIATTVELTNCIFDFATTATGRYPKMPMQLRKQHPFFVILDVSMPGGSYTWFGTALWLLYPLCVLAYCLRLDAAGRFLLIPAALYIWCESAWAAKIIGCWTEPPRETPLYDDTPAGFRHTGSATEHDRRLISEISACAISKVSDAYEANRRARQIFWINMWQRSRPDDRLEAPRADELDRWAHALADRVYAGEGVLLDGYGLIVNPAGSEAQAWHIDYTADYSTVFVPMTPLTPENAPQYAVFPKPPGFKNPDRVDLAEAASVSPWMSVRQLIAPEWSYLRMDFGTIHRGIANTSGKDRTMFWVSVKKQGALLPPEPDLENFDRPVVSPVVSKD